MSVRIRWYLPSSQVSLALLLGYLGSIQFAARATGRLLVDYVAPAEYALRMINMPVALVVLVITRSSMFQLGLAHSRWVFSIYVLLIGLFWYLIGRSISQVRDRKADGLDLLLLLFCLTSIVLSVMPLFGPVSVLFS